MGAAQRVHSSPAPDGIWMVVEPAAGGSLEENFDPVGRVYHRASSMICTSASLSDPKGAGLGARATSGQLCAVARAGGLGRCRLAAKTSFDRVFEFRP